MYTADKIAYNGNDSYIRMYQGSTLLWEKTIESDLRVYLNNGTYEDYSYSDGVIPAYAFDYRTEIIGIYVGNRITSIGKNAFYSCWNLSSVTFEEGSQLTSIGSGAFQNCYELTSITIPASITKIDTYAFYGCSSLREITCLADSLPVGGKNAFTGIATGGTFYYKDAYNYLLQDTWNGVLYDGIYNYKIYNSAGGSREYYFSDGIIPYAGGNILWQGIATRAEIGSGITEIGGLAFSDNGHLTAVTFEENSELERIGQNAFQNCTGLTSFVIPAMVQTIGGSAFYGCSNLSSVTFEEGSNLKSLSLQAFFNCYALNEITIPATNKSIGRNCFSGCTSLSAVTFEENSQLETIYPNAFDSCYALVEFTVPASTTSIGSAVFYNCNALTSVTIENAASLEFSDSVFASCDNLKTIVTYATTAPTITENTFYCIANGSSGTLYYPAGSDYSSWLGNKFNQYYLKYYNWNAVEI